MIVLVMGVSGAGKSTVGTLLARALDATFIEADDHHPPANVEKMQAGVPLDDADRWPWLDALAGAIREAVALGRVVVACSALRRRYRDRLLAGQSAPVRVVHLTGSPAVIGARMSARTGHYMPASLLPTQIAALEVPDDAITVDVSLTLEVQIRTILHLLEGIGAH